MKATDPKTSGRSVSLEPYQRFLLMHTVLPKQGGSFEEMLQVNAVRNLLAFSDAEVKILGYEESPITAAINKPSALSLVAPKQVALTPEYVRLIALGFKLLQASRQVPNSAAFVGLYRMFEEDIKAVEV